MTSSHTQLCTFTVDDLVFGVEVTQIQEVIRYQPMTRVPLAPTVIRGLINLRGQIVTAIDLRACLGLPSRADDALPMNVVVRSHEGPVSFLVDTIGDVIDVPDDAFEPPPSTMKAAQRDFVDAVCKLSNKLLLLLDAQQAVAHAADSHRARGAVRQVTR